MLSHQVLLGILFMETKSRVPQASPELSVTPLLLPSECTCHHLQLKSAPQSQIESLLCCVKLARIQRSGDVFGATHRVLLLLNQVLLHSQVQGVTNRPVICLWFPSCKRLTALFSTTVLGLSTCVYVEAGERQQVSSNSLCLIV